MHEYSLKKQSMRLAKEQGTQATGPTEDWLPRKAQKRENENAAKFSNNDAVLKQKIETSTSTPDQWLAHFAARTPLAPPGTLVDALSQRMRTKGGIAAPSHPREEARREAT